jgi:signal transduction histidine kinase
MAEPVRPIEGQAVPRRLLTVVGEPWDDTRSRSAARGRRVARDLVELSRLQSGAEQPELRPLDLVSLLRTIAADYPHVAIDGPAQLPFITDSRRLARILFALLDNACLHGAPPITIAYDAGAILVEDRGAGFPQRVLARAPAPFLTGDRSHGRGVGLGLAIAARQAALLGGQLELANSPSGGAAVRLRFTAPAPQAPDAAA